MREILFRGKRTDNGDWVHGDLAHHRDGRVFIRCWERLELDPVYNAFEVNPETVGQFTGLTDKNGKKIFEGDIVKFHMFRDEPDWIGAVKYDTTICLYMLVGDMPDGNPFEVQVSSRNKKTFEVIGNIHDNPELLEVGVDG